tara:strand:+ start:294 stop:737 length:444 start_codon:yes stop_codon:yes gene_type:complete
MGTKFNAKQIMELLSKDNQSHKIRSTLESIFGYSEMLQDSNLSLDQKQVLDHILSSSKDMASVVATSQQNNHAIPAIIKDVAVIHQEVKHSQLMYKALWAAVALLIGWSLASHQFLVSSSKDIFQHQISMVELKLQNLSEDLHYHEN